MLRSNRINFQFRKTNIQVQCQMRFRCQDFSSTSSDNSLICVSFAHQYGEVKQKVQKGWTIFLLVFTNLQIVLLLVKRLIIAQQGNKKKTKHKITDKRIILTPTVKPPPLPFTLLSVVELPFFNSACPNPLFCSINLWRLAKRSRLAKRYEPPIPSYHDMQVIV